MLKFGIVSRDQIAQRFHPHRTSAENPPIACTVLEQFDENLSDDDYRVIDHIFQALPGGPTKLKSTRRRRYQSVDVSIIEEMNRIFPSDQPVRIHDMAASSAITSLDFYKELTHWENAQFHASDYYHDAIVVSVPDSSWRVVFDRENRPVQFIGKRFVLSAGRPERRRLPGNWLYQRFLKATLLPRATKLLHADSEEAGHLIHHVSLFHPACLALARCDPRFTLGRHNILEACEKQYDVVRLMALVGGFSEDLLQPMFRKVGQCVADGGLLVVGREERVPGPESRTVFPTTVFQRCGARFQVTHELVGGVDCKDIVLQLELTPATRGNTIE